MFVCGITYMIDKSFKCALKYAPKFFNKILNYIIQISVEEVGAGT